MAPPPDNPRPRGALLGLALVLALGAVVYFVWPKPGATPTAPVDASPLPAPGPTKVAPSEIAPPSALEVRRIERGVAERLREAVREARAVRAAAEEAAHQAELERAIAGALDEALEPPTPAGAEPTRRAGSIDPQYIRDAMRAIVPLMEECYELGVAEAEQAGDPPLEGRVVMEYVFAGEPEVGGVVEESHVLEDGTTLQSAALHECLQETLYTLELPAPDGGGVITVRYPLQFAPSDPEPTEPAD